MVTDTDFIEKKLPIVDLSQLKVSSTPTGNTV